jgi:leucyl aminopeptidase
MACDFLTDLGGPNTVLLTPIGEAALAEWLDRQPEPLRRWVGDTRFAAEPGTACLIGGANGGLERVLVGIGEEGEIWDWAALPKKLPEAVYRIDRPLCSKGADAAALGWALGTYRFGRYRKHEGNLATLAWPDDCDRAGVERAASATFLVRDLINTPADDMGPEELAAAAKTVAERHGAQVSVIVGDELKTHNYPAVYAIGRACSRAPRLIDLRWGDESAPKVTLVGKGVCFDSGGLDIKMAAGMKLMKKDMGGAATMLGLAQMVMSANLPVRLRLLIPAVENSISGNALHPLDVVQTRKGLTVEIGNTDAEGRVILADALAEAATEQPALLVDCATLTGAARVALGTELPALFTNDDAFAEELLAHGTATSDPFWRLPLWKPYRRHIDSKVADLNNAPDIAFAGAITAALFLAEFAKPARPWAHIDVMAWNTDSKPGRPEGGEAMGMRALYAMLRQRFGS